MNSVPHDDRALSDDEGGERRGPQPARTYPRRRTPAEAAAATAERADLPDLIAHDLDVLLVGINPSPRSAADGRHFVGPSNRLWPALHRSGFTPRRLSAVEEDQLLELGVGITSIVRRPTVKASELTRAEYEQGGEDLRRRAAAFRPTWLALLGVTGYRAAFGVPGATVGFQPTKLGQTRIWVLPNPSGLNAHYTPATLAIEFARLRVAAGLPDRSGILGDGPFDAPRA